MWSLGPVATERVPEGAVYSHSKEFVVALLTQLVHNGIVVPSPPPYQGLAIEVRGRSVQLTPKQEEMALAWAKKQGTAYVEDPVFCQNFMLDFGAALGIEERLRVDEVNFAAVNRVVEAEREAKARRTKEERKAQAAVRKAIREELKEKYGYATVNGQRVELGNYMTEPSGIFMGRGEHPLRGRWKEGAVSCDVTLNLSPDAPPVEGEWAEIVWQPDSLWVAKWEDKLSGKLKYVWLADTAPVKQQREAAKFDKAMITLHDSLDKVRAQVQAELQDADLKRRKIAVACYLIDALCLRVGDEKDADEADTVGATTLRPEHVILNADGTAEFKFLGKDSVLWHKEIVLPPLVQETLEELIRTARPSTSSNGDSSHPTRDLPQLFPDIGSRNVNTFLSRIQKGLSAKVFRTHHATEIVQQHLEGAGVTANDPEHLKWKAAVVANLQAAELCNHTKKATANWSSVRQRYEERLGKAKARVERYRQQIAERKEKLKSLRLDAKAEAAKSAARRSIASMPERVQKKPELVKKRLGAERERYAKVKARYAARIQKAREQIELTQQRLQRARLAEGKIRAQMLVRSMVRTWNLNTSLKSYIDPRVYYAWGQSVDYDVIERYYPKTLRRRFAWVRGDSGEAGSEDESISDS